MTAAPDLLDLQAEWAGLVIATLIDAGVRVLVASPGSRSAPLVHAAARDDRLHVVDIVDERVAAFYALGRARLDDVPVALVCTSGSAGAHYLPAIVEANHARVPLIAITADRPLELVDCAAPQTIDQQHLFGAHVRGFVELGAPDAAPAALVALRRRVAQAVALARAPVAGAVHVNARFRKPLEPQPASAGDRAAAGHARALRATPVPRVARAPIASACEELVELCRGARRPLVACGPAPVAQVAARGAAAALAWPRFAEAASQLRFGVAGACDAFDALLRVPRFCARLAPDRIVQLGAPLTSTAWASFVDDHPGVPRAIVAPHGWNDPASTAALHVHADAAAALRALASHVAADPVWLARVHAASAVARRAIDALVGDEPGLGEATAVRLAVASVPAGGVLAVGNSLPIRTVDLACAATATAAPVLSQRGASGIDGLVAGAAGAASTGRPLTLVVGDVSVLHDIGGLAIAARASSPLVICVINNGGGRIFEQLPVATSPQLSHFTTPHAVDFAHAAALYGLAYARADSPAELARALASAQATRGATLVDAVVGPDSAARLAAALPRQVERALVAEGLA